jgi:hypothetical protein
MLAVGAVVMGAAVLGPLYARAAGESTLRDELTQAGPATGLEYGSEFATSASSFTQDESLTPAPGAVRGYPTRIGSIYVQTSAQAAAGPGVRVGMLWRAGACAHLIIVSGHCPDGTGQVLVSQRTVNGYYGWRLGGQISFGVGVTARIVGTYVPRDPQEVFWFGHSYFRASGPPTVAGDAPDTVDAVFVDQAETGALPAGAQAILQWDYPLDPAAIRLADVPGLRRDVAGLLLRNSETRSCTTSCPGNPDDVTMSTDLGKVLDAAAHQRSLVDRGTLLVTVQLALLAWLVLFEVVSDSVESRGNEIALAKLRGLRPWRTAWFAVSEPLVLLVVAAPIGFGLGWLATRLFSSAVLAPHTPVALTWPAAAALAGGFVGGVVAAVAACYRTLTRSVLAQWRRTTRSPRRSRAGLVVDVVVSAAAVAGLVVLLTGSAHGTSVAALLVPGLLVMAVALLGTRLLPLLARTLLRPTRASGRIGLFLAARQVARRPAGLRLAAMLAVAVGLASFGVSGEAVAAGNRDARAQAELGAERVVAMQFARGVDPVAAVARADPDGQWAMAAATWLPDGGDSVVGTVLAVDASRLARLGYPASGGPSSQQIADMIGRSTVAPLVTTATKMRVVIGASGMRGVPPLVEFIFRSPAAPFLTVSAGTLQPGTHTYTATLDCAGGCTLLGLAWNRSDPSGALSGTVTVQSVEWYQQARWVPVNASLTKPGAWRAGPEFSQSTDKLRATPDGLRDDYQSSSGYGGISYAFAPQPLPVVATRAAVISGYLTPDPPEMIDSFSTVATFSVRQWAGVLPVVLDRGLIANLSFVRAVQPGFDTEANWMVWLGPHAPPDAIARLHAAGLTLQHENTTGSRIIQLGRQAPALSLFLLLACAIIGSVVAVGGTAIAITASARRRSHETAALGVVGVPRPALYRGAVLEQVMLLGAAVILGLPAGALAARLALPVIPQFADTTPIVLRYQLPTAALITFAAAFVVLVVLTGMVAAAAVLRAAVPARLREAEE